MSISYYKTVEKFKKYIFIGLLFTGCQTQEQKIPKDILPKQQMVAILQELHQTEAKLLDAQLSVDTATALYKNYLTDICKKHQTDTAAFEKSFQYYSSYPDYFDLIYEAVIDSLNRNSQVE